jgi:hypothetical protein
MPGSRPLAANTRSGRAIGRYSTNAKKEIHKMSRIVCADDCGDHRNAPGAITEGDSR